MTQHIQAEMKKKFPNLKKELRKYNGQFVLKISNVTSPGRDGGCMGGSRQGLIASPGHTETHLELGVISGDKLLFSKDHACHIPTNNRHVVCHNIFHGETKTVEGDIQIFGSFIHMMGEKVEKIITGEEAVSKYFDDGIDERKLIIYYKMSKALNRPIDKRAEFEDKFLSLRVELVENLRKGILDLAFNSDYSRDRRMQIIRDIKRQLEDGVELGIKPDLSISSFLQLCEQCCKV